MVGSRLGNSCEYRKKLTDKLGLLVISIYFRQDVKGSKAKPYLSTLTYTDNLPRAIHTTVNIAVVHVLLIHHFPVVNLILVFLPNNVVWCRT